MHATKFVVIANENHLPYIKHGLTHKVMKAGSLDNEPILGTRVCWCSDQQTAQMVATALNAARDLGLEVPTIPGIDS